MATDEEVVERSDWSDDGSNERDCRDGSELGEGGGGRGGGGGGRKEGDKEGRRGRGEVGRKLMRVHLSVQI